MYPLMAEGKNVPKIAILGSSGFLGKPISNIYSSAGWEVERLTRTTSSNIDGPQQYTDIFDEASLKEFLSKVSPQVVISAAWDTEHGKFWTSELNEAYRDATLRFAELCFEANVETFVGLGTMSEYGLSPGFCNSEFSALIISDIYSKSKIETGLELKKIGEKHGCQTHWVRVFQAFGPREKPERFVPGLITQLGNGKQFSIRTPDYEMDWIHSVDVASAIKFALDNNLNHFVDIGTGVGTSVREFSKLICSELDLDESLLDFSEQIPGHEKQAVVDPRSQLLLRGWKPDASLRDRIRSLR